MAEIKIDPTQPRALLPWLLGLALLLLVIWFLVKTMDPYRLTPASHGSAASDTLGDKTPPHLRQFA